jgi:undecaprenyl pyrophosphate synthase
MNKRQTRELAIAVIVLLLGVTAGWAYRTYAPANNKEAVVTPSSESTAPATTKTIDPLEVVARLNGQDITRGEVERYYHANMGIERVDEATATEETKQEMRSAALQQIIDERLLWEAAPKEGVTISKEEVEEYIKKTALAGFTDEAEFEASLKKDLGLTIDELKDMLARQELAVKMRTKLSLNIAVTDTELDKEIKAFQELMKTHPGGKVDLPAREQMREELLEKKAMHEYNIWLEAIKAKAKVEILDLSLMPAPTRLSPHGMQPGSGQPVTEHRTGGMTGS